MSLSRQCGAGGVEAKYASKALCFLLVNASGPSGPSNWKRPKRETPKRGCTVVSPVPPLWWPILHFSRPSQQDSAGAIEGNPPTQGATDLLHPLGLQRALEQIHYLSWSFE